MRIAALVIRNKGSKYPHGIRFVHFYDADAVGTDPNKWIWQEDHCLGSWCHYTKPRSNPKEYVRKWEHGDRAVLTDAQRDALWQETVKASTANPENTMQDSIGFVFRV